MNNHLKWRLSALAFLVLTLLFVVFNGHIEYLLDASGLTGMKPLDEIETLDTPAMAAVGKGKAQKKAKGVPTLPTPADKMLYSIDAKKPLVIDGVADDWDLHAGRFLCDDCLNNNSTASTWMHTMYDAENFYLFSRVRHPMALKSSANVTSDLKSTQLVQAQLQTADLATAINVWRNDVGKGVLQLHYFMPKRYPRKTEKTEKKKKGSLFGSEDAAHREDGLANGATMAIREHADEHGADIECAIPWKLLCRDPASRPTTGMDVGLAFAARLNNDIEIGKLQLLTNKPNPLNRLFLVDERPAWPSLVEVKSEVEPKGLRVYTTTLNPSEHRLDVSWSTPYSPEAMKIAELHVLPATEPPTIDGNGDDWPTIGEVMIGESLANKNGRTTLKASSDAKNLYVHASVMDVTPEGNGNAVTLSLKTDRIHTLVFTMDDLTVDGEGTSASGARFTSLMADDHLSYSIEAAIPWRLLTATGTTPGTFPITATIDLNPIWSIRGLFGDQPVTTADGQAEEWALARVLDKVPTERKPVTLMNNFCIDLDAGPLRRIRYDKGIIARHPYATWNAGIDVLPGTPIVDGDGGDWDLSGGIFLCNNLRMFRKTNALWFHAMYDAERLYLLYRFFDATPMKNANSKSFVNRDDMAEFRIMVDGKPTTIGNAVFEKGNIVHTAVMPQGKNKPDPKLAKSVQAAYKKATDGTGYVLEASIPWTALGLSDKAPKADESLPAYLLARTSGSMLLSSAQTSGSCMSIERMPDLFGTATFRAKAPIRPRPCRLASGQTVPVIMRDGKPQLDLSGLK